MHDPASTCENVYRCGCAANVEAAMTAQADGFNDAYWQAGRGAPVPCEPVRDDARADVAIIGAGFTGLSAAYHLKVADPALNVAVLEAEVAGFGASGRNAGFVMTLFGASLGLMKSLHGKERVRQAHLYMESAIDELESLVEQHKIDCDFARTGFLKIATAPAYIPRIKEEIELMQSLGLRGIEWIERDEVLARVKGTGFLGAALERHCGSLSPLKWLDGLRRIALAAGAKLFEHSPVQSIERVNGRYRLKTPTGTLTADKIVYATNGYTHLIPGMKSKQTPAFAYIIVTEPLTAEQLGTVGWGGREGIEDARNFMHFYRLTPDNRLLVGGGPGVVPYAGNMANDAYPKAWNHLEHFIGETFPALKGIRVDYRWGGAFSVTANSTPQIGTLDGGGAAYSFGCTGHGVAMTHMNGQVLRDLILERKTDLTGLWFVNRRSMALPPEPLRSLGVKAVTAAMALDDYWCGRSAKSAL